MALGLLPTAASLAFADPVLEAHQQCAVSDPEQAHRLGDVLFEQGDYQRAGECYRTAREYALADRAFFKAAGPESALTARRLADQRDQARALLRQVQQAFHVEH